MTREEYAELRDAFARLAKEVESLAVDAFALDDEVDEGPEEHANALDAYGYYMSGDEYLQVLAAVRVLEGLAGRNAARSL